MQDLSIAQRKAYVGQKSAERKAIQDEIQELSKKRQDYIAAHTSGEQEDTMLDAAMIKAIKEAARAKNFTWQ